MRVFLHLHECGTVLPDEEGIEVASMAAARDHAISVARELIATEVQAGHLCLGCYIDIEPEDGGDHITVLFRDVVRIVETPTQS